MMKAVITAFLIFGSSSTGDCSVLGEYSSRGSTEKFSFQRFCWQEFGIALGLFAQCFVYLEHFQVFNLCCTSSTQGDTGRFGSVLGWLVVFVGFVW